MNYTAMTTTHAVNIVYLYVFGFCITLLIGITATMIFFVVKYDRKKHPNSGQTPDSIPWLETAWIAVPTLIALSMFYFGLKGYTTSIHVPSNALLDKYGCTGCHSTDGSAGTGPTWKGLYGSNVVVTTSGKKRTVMADTKYIIRSIKHPDADIVKGFRPIMPPGAGLSKQQVEAIVDSIKTLK